MTLFIGIDVGTSACRACAINAQGDEVATARSSLPAPSRNGSEIEQDPGVWWQALQDTLDWLCSNIDCNEVKRIAIDGTSSTLLLCTPAGQPPGPALMYNDTRAIKQAEQLANSIPDNNPARGASSSLSKLLWLLEHHPADEYRALHQADWLTGKLLGQFDNSDENNCLKLGYDAVQRTWPDWLEQLALPASCLPNVFPAGTPLGTLLPEFQTRWRFCIRNNTGSGHYRQHCRIYSNWRKDDRQRRNSFGFYTGTESVG